MDPTFSANLPLVIQQAGDVSRVQEAVQRLPQVHQAAATAEGAREQAREKEQVQRTDGSEAENRVRADQGGQGPDHQRQGHPRRRRPPEEPEPAPPPRLTQGVVDVIV